MAIAAIALTSCKKDEPATSELGEATINGNVWADLDQTDDFESGIYVQNLNPEGVEGMTVYIEVNTSSYVQNPVAGYDYEVRTYTATTDANGDYSFTLPATEDGFNVTIRFEDLYTTRIALAEDGVSGLTENVEVTRGTVNAFIYSGAVISKKDQASVSLVNGNANEYATGKVFGTVYANWNDGLNSTGFWEICDAASPLAGKSISWAYYDGPYGEGEMVWTSVAIAADGTYEIELTTESAGMNTVGIEFGFYDFVDDQIIPNFDNTVDSTASSIFSVQGIDGESQGGIEAGELEQYDIYIDVTNI